MQVAFRLRVVRPYFFVGSTARLFPVTLLIDSSDNLCHVLMPMLLPSQLLLAFVAVDSVADASDRCKNSWIGSPQTVVSFSR